MISWSLLSEEWRNNVPSRGDQQVQRQQRPRQMREQEKGRTMKKVGEKMIGLMESEA